jgi:hypothetical protein
MAITETSKRREALRKPGDTAYQLINGGADVGMVWEGCIAVIDTDGYARTYAPDIASGKFAGVARDSIDNLGGADGDTGAEFWKTGTFVFNYSTLGTAYGTAVQADIGKVVYIVNNDTVTIDKTKTTGEIACGTIVELLDSGKQVRIAIDDYAV